MARPEYKEKLIMKIVYPTEEQSKYLAENGISPTMLFRQAIKGLQNKTLIYDHTDKAL